MSVHQIEQYYIHIEAERFNQERRGEVLYFLRHCDEPFDFEVTETIVIDGFESQSDAEEFESKLSVFLK